MNILSYSGLLMLTLNTLIALFLFWKGWGKKVSRILGFFCLAVAIWGLSSFKFSIVRSKEEAIFWWKFGYIGCVFPSILYLHFVVSLLKLNRKFIVVLGYFLSIVFLVINLFFNSSFLTHFRIIFDQFYWHDWLEGKSTSFIFYLLYLYTLPLYSFFLLAKAYKNSKGIFREQLKYFILGSLIGWFGTAGDYIIVFRVNIYPYANFLIAIYPLVWTYAIIKYRLMDIKVAITRVGIFIFVYTLVLGLPFALAIKFKDSLVERFGPQWWMLPLGLMAVLATVGPFIYIYLQNKAEERLLREQKRYQNTLKQASMGMVRIRNLRRLLDLITHIVTKTVRISYAAIYLYDAEANEYVLQVSRDKGRIPIPKVTSDNPLIAWISVKREPLIYEEIKRQAEESHNETFRQLEENMRLLTATVVIPTYLEDKFLGIFVLGDKVSGQIYTPDDLYVFQILASQAALAIENAQFYEETKEMTAQVAQAEKMATIGTMADGLSHQINNRFNALSLIAGDTIDTIKLTDTSKCTPEVKEMVDQVNYALQRIQSNVMQGGEVVRGLLKYSRTQDDTHEALDLNDIIDNTLEMVQFKVKLPEIDIIRNFDNIPKIKGNMTQLEEVFFNFIDNAYEAIVERRTTLKEEGYRGRITVSAQAKDSGLEIIFQDNGMGVKEEDFKKLFTPFFTTKVSGRKGTGLGLYVIKRIITDMHQGKIALESEYKIGTRFIIELPTAK